ncbi:MAG: cupin domain-containing protein [Clostridia bacterium]|nr:cupin domain-containing protein [Clostridia bacterium]MBR0509529.1 cupin domain-containing protein [Clostridia bacterium]MBR0537070.1 cupin domain-containing protein [Clostridia bacterium]
MVIRETLQHREAVRGGKGCVDFYHVVPKEMTDDYVHMFAKLVIRPASSIGWHQHTGETEPYYILAGEGLFTDSDGTQTKVGPGDVCLIRNGDFHAIENLSGTEDLSLMAVIYKQD